VRGHHGIQTERGQQQRGDAEQADEKRVEARAAQRTIEIIGKRSGPPEIAAEVV
jgi:hypothetical protein